MAGAVLWARSEIRDGWRSLIVVGVLVAVVDRERAGVGRRRVARRLGARPLRRVDRPGRARSCSSGASRRTELVDEIAADPRVERVGVSTVAKIGPGAGRSGVQRDHRSGRSRSAATGGRSS